MKAFILGGAGFIGSHFCELLLKRNIRTTVYDNLSAGILGNLESCMTSARFKFIRADLNDTAKLRRAMAGHDFVFHFADATDIRTAFKHPGDYVDGNVLGNFKVLEAMRANGIRDFAYPSSTAVFVDATTIPTPEDYGPLLPQTLYGGSKLANEGLISSYAHTYGMRAWIFRFADIVGGRMNHGVLFDFINKLKQDPARLGILGNGKQMRSFLLVDECARAALHAIERSKEQVGIYNVGSQDQISITAAAKVITRTMGLRGVRFEYAGGARGWKGDALSNFITIKKLRRLGWKPRYDSAESLAIATGRLAKEIRDA